MELMMDVLCREKIRLEEKLRSAEKKEDAEKTDDEKRLETVNSDIERLEMYIDRSSMQTWSELLFVDDIRQRVRQIQKEQAG
ncbi:hypothetical protein LJC19_03030 [Oxalobacter sp. OttesenSCG-928-P03]|nr:hypothetical protein [Oxalobacter sp. OttesenSCG-928-P03]